MSLPWEAFARLSCSLLPAQTHLMVQLHALWSGGALHAEGAECGRPAYKSSLLRHSQRDNQRGIAFPSASLDT